MKDTEKGNEKMSRDLNRDHRGPSRPTRTEYESPKERRLLADIFVKTWLQQSSRPSVLLGWLKVVAERVMADLVGVEDYVWLTEQDLEQALRAADYRLRRAKGCHVYVYCTPQASDGWRFLRRGGVIKRKR